jgi:hypothetical protein
MKALRIVAWVRSTEATTAQSASVVLDRSAQDTQGRPMLASDTEDRAHSKREHLTSTPWAAQ